MEQPFMTTTPNSPSELFELNNQRKDEEPNMGLLFSELDKLDPKSTAHLIKGLVTKVEAFHEFIVNKRIEDGVTEDNIQEFSLWLLDMKSWRLILQEIHNISDFCDNDE